MVHEKLFMIHKLHLISGTKDIFMARGGIYLVCGSVQVVQVVQVAHCALM